MITKDDIAKAVRHSDRWADQWDIVSFWRNQSVDLNGLTYVAEQRALRACMILQGMDPKQSRPVEVKLTKTSRALFPLFAAAFMDGFAAGMVVKKKR